MSYKPRLCKGHHTIFRKIRKSALINGRTTINIELQPQAISGKEMVVVGYGTQAREEVTTSISKMDSTVLNNVPYDNAASAMQGTVTGVRVQQTSGQPGAAPRIIVRGGTSINNPNGASPLYVIDGLIREDMNNISSEDIKSLQVLKDAAATAIYGARGSNGVVLIETKSGKAGQTRVSYSFNYSFSEPTKTYNLASARDYLRLSRKGYISPNGLPDDVDVSSKLTDASGFGTGNDLSKNTAFTTQYLTPENKHKLDEGWESMPDPVDPSKTLIFKGTNWQDVLFRRAVSQNHHLSVSGGSDKATFRASLGYLGDEGTAITTDMNRYTLNLKGDFKVNNRLSFFGNANYVTSTDQQVTNINRVFARWITMPPTVKYRFEDGSIAPGSDQRTGNPQYYLNKHQGDNKKKNLTFIFGSKLDILQNLSFNPRVSLYRKDNSSYSFWPKYLYSPGNVVDNRNANNSIYEQQKTQVTATLAYSKAFLDLHNIHATLGVCRTNQL